MSRHAFKKLIETIAYSETRPRIKHGDVLDAAREVIRSSSFKEFQGLPDMLPTETRIKTKKSGLTTYPIGIYSFDHLEDNNIRRYIFMLLTKDNQHVYVKLMLNDTDLSLDYHKISLVQIEEKQTYLYDMTGHDITEILVTLKEAGVEL